MPDEVVRSVYVLEVDRDALVLGSTQPDDVVTDRPGGPGVEVVRRHSGGGAVYLAPGNAVWLDVEIPRGDPWWDDDVGRASWWLGERWAAALGDLGVPSPTVYRGGLAEQPWSKLACFAGLGPGEVTAGPLGPKVLGISQRRTRGGARFQCAVPLASQFALTSLLRLTRREVLGMALWLEERVRPLTGVTGEQVVAAFLAHLTEG